MGETQRSDWLTDDLAGRNKVFVSGSPKCSSRMKAAGLLTLRLFGHHPANVTPPKNSNERRTWMPPYYELPFAVLTCELPDGTAVISFDPKVEETVRSYFQKAIGIPIYLVGYSADNKDLSLSFYVSNPSGMASMMMPKDYAQEINKLRVGYSDEEPSEIKEINKTLNDVFQRFTRSMVSWQYSINDLDALVAVPGGIAFLELKRSSKKLWSPYVNDAPNYLLMRSLTRKSPSGVDFTLRYDEDSTKIDVHTLLDVSREVIPGYSVTFSGVDGGATVDALLRFLNRPDMRIYSSMLR